MSNRRVLVFPSAAEVGPALARLVTARADQACGSPRGRFSMGVSGGSLVGMLSKELTALLNLDCSRWVVGFCDERVVPFSDPESTYGLYKVMEVANALWHFGPLRRRISIGSVEYLLWGLHYGSGSSTVGQNLVALANNKNSM